MGSSEWRGYGEAEEIARLPADKALEFVSEKLGPGEEFQSPLLEYRFTSEFQRPWVIEVGRWLKTAERCGFLDPLLQRVVQESKRRSKRFPPGSPVHPNDDRHLKLQQHIVEARIAHYLTGTGWAFESYQSETGGDVDVDVSLSAPDGTLVEIQAKVPDRPGVVRENGFRIEDGEDDQTILDAARVGAAQLRKPATGPSMVFLCPARGWPFTTGPGRLVRYLMGSTVQLGDDPQVYLRRAKGGVFFTNDWNHVAGVAVLDVSVWGEFEHVSVTYACVVVLNPFATCPASPDWFPRSRVLTLDANVFAWRGGPPGPATGFPNGTRLVDEVPGDW